MTPEEKVNQNVWYVLQKIKEENLVGGKNRVIKYRVPDFIGGGIPSKDRIKDIIKQYLAKQEGAIKVVGNAAPNTYIFKLKLIQPKFDEVYNNFQERNELQINSRGKRKTNEWIKWDGLELNVSDGRCKYKKMHTFKIKKPHFLILRQLIEKQGQEVTDHDFFTNPGLKEHLPESGEKDNKEWVRKKVRDIRRVLGINIHKNPEDNIFQWTGGGCHLISPKRP